MNTHSDPAEARGYLRYFYRNWRPTHLGRAWSRGYAWLVGLGLASPALVSLQVTNRQSGRLDSVVLVAATYREGRYLVSMLGENSQWVQNVRVSGGNAYLKRGSLRPVLLREIPVEGRAPILKAWCQIATSGRKHLPIDSGAPVEAFARIAADYPVFRIDSGVSPGS
jgi:hypothetical protein